jgi:CRP-like cAMP-binding protein
MTSSTVSTVRMNDLYAGLSAEVRQELARYEQVLTVPAGTRLAECGAPADQLIFLDSGTAKSYLRVGDRKISLDIAGPGTVFGLSSVLADQPLDRGLTCLEQCQVSILPKKAFLEVLNRNPQVYCAVVKVLSADLAGADRIIRTRVRVGNSKASCSTREGPGDIRASVPLWAEGQ